MDLLLKNFGSAELFSEKCQSCRTHQRVFLLSVFELMDSLSVPPLHRRFHRLHQSQRWILAQIPFRARFRGQFCFRFLCRILVRVASQGKKCQTSPDFHTSPELRVFGKSCLDVSVVVCNLAGANVAGDANDSHLRPKTEHRSDTIGDRVFLGKEKRCDEQRAELFINLDALIIAKRNFEDKTSEGISHVDPKTAPISLNTHLQVVTREFG